MDYWEWQHIACFSEAEQITNQIADIVDHSTKPVVVVSFVGVVGPGRGALVARRGRGLRSL
ncbi:hypothetical protein ACFZAV_40185 [Streptomyces sp. NPDC008343]|uniref:hypothetical protein n=1 Tax=Streptomyces sp. NPDC008343 TaxID=3364828 RepID=UPI0036EA400D